MPLNIEYTIEEDALYEMGMEKGIEKGIEKGMEKGIEKGIEKQKAIEDTKRLVEKKNAVLKMLEAQLTVEQIANFLNEDVSSILKIKKDSDKKK